MQITPKNRLALAATEHLTSRPVIKKVTARQARRRTVTNYTVPPPTPR
jgi:hypothetical protein